MREHHAGFLIPIPREIGETVVCTTLRFNLSTALEVFREARDGGNTRGEAARYALRLFFTQCSGVYRKLP